MKETKFCQSCGMLLDSFVVKMPDKQYVAIMELPF